MPPTGTGAIVDSLNGQLKPPPDHKIDPRAAHILASGYTAVCWNPHEKLFDMVERHFIDICGNKGLGWFLFAPYKDKGEYLKNHVAYGETIARLVLLFAYDTDTLAFATPWDLYRAGIILPEIEKVKSEAHKGLKLMSDGGELSGRLASPWSV